MPPRTSRAVERAGPRAVSERLLEPFAMDVRSLAAFRIGLALVLIADLAERAADLGAHYTDAGMVTRADTLVDFGFLHAWGVSVHLATGSWIGTALLFGVHGAAALALLVGHRTRVATIVCWLLLASLQLRNLFVGLAYDAILRLGLFWGCFLPLGATWSLDQARGRCVAVPSRRVLGVGTIALLAQIAIVYLGPGLGKAETAAWRNGTALALVLNDELQVTHVGAWIASFPAFCRVATWAVLGWELLAPLLFLVPIAFGPLRCVALGGLWGMHLGFALGLRLGLFPAVDAVVLLALLPAWAWDRLGASPDVDVWRDGRRWPAWMRRAWRVPASPPPARPVARRAGGALAAVLLALLVTWTVGVARDPAYVAPPAWQWLWNGLFLQQDFRMFAQPPRRTGWVTVAGTLRDGTAIDLLASGGRVPRDVVPVAPPTRPAHVASTFANQRYRQLFKNIVYRTRGERPALLYGRHVCRTWNARHRDGQVLETFEIAFMHRPVRPEPPYTTPPAAYARDVAWRHWCFK
jgi:hypothetical protein